MLINHNPNEPSHAALKIIGVLTAVIVLAFAIPVIMGVRWVAELLPAEAVGAFGIAFMVFAAGFFAGRWDAVRQFRTPGRDE